MVLSAVRQQRNVRLLYCMSVSGSFTLLDNTYVRISLRYLDSTLANKQSLMLLLVSVFGVCFLSTSVDLVVHIVNKLFKF